MVRKVPPAIIDLPEILLNESMTGIGKLQCGIYAADEWQQWAVNFYETFRPAQFDHKARDFPLF